MKGDVVDIIESMKECLLDISDIGYFVQCGRNGSDSNTYITRISKHKPVFNQNNRYYGEFGHDEWGGYDGLESDLDNFMESLSSGRSIKDMNRGMKTYMEIQKDISFLCSYIPDMYGVVIKSMSIEFTENKRPSYHQQKSNNYSISKDDFYMEPIYWKNKSSSWISLFESKLYPGILDSDIKHIDILFEREIPESVRKMMDDILNDRHITQHPKESWISRIIKRIKGV